MNPGIPEDATKTMIGLLREAPTTTTMRENATATTTGATIEIVGMRIGICTLTSGSADAARPLIGPGTLIGHEVVDSFQRGAIVGMLP
jgi:hypothetical protein